jgi:hypothetical protein
MSAIALAMAAEARFRTGSIASRRMSSIELTADGLAMGLLPGGEHARGARMKSKERLLSNQNRDEPFASDNYPIRAMYTI